VARSPPLSRDAVNQGVETIDTAERRARLALRHHLAKRCDSVVKVAGDLVGLHSSDPASVFLAARARVRNFSVGQLESELYDRRSLVRMLGMRRTMFVIPRDLAAVMDAACTQALSPGERKRLLGMLEDQSIAADPARWLRDVEERTLDALRERGEATATQLTKVVPELGLKLRFGEGKSWQADVGISTRVLFLLATEGRIVRGRPRGSWISSQYRWAPIDTWLGEGLDLLPAAEARAAWAERWLGAFGPGTLKDLKWWTGWTVAQTKAALRDVDAVEVGLDAGTGYVLPDDLEPTRKPRSWVALLPGLDPTVMGWKEREWFLDGYEAELFDRNGNAGPTVWWNGRVIGSWLHQPNRSVAVHLLEDVPASARAAIDEEAARLGSWLGDVRISPRFRTPRERALLDGQ
jgi:hypothetical protein